MGASGSFAIIYIYNAELYPTVVRGTAMGLSSLAGRIGGILAPLVSIECTAMPCKTIITIIILLPYIIF